MPNGLFWTMAIPENSFRVTHEGSRARLKFDNLPIPDTFFYSNNVSVAGEVDVDVSWTATSDPVERGLGDTVPPDDFGAFLASFADAQCEGRAKGRETGFTFHTDDMDASGFFAELGHERNGVFL